MRSASGLQISGAIGGEDLSNKIKRHRRVSEEVRKPLNGLWRDWYFKLGTVADLGERIKILPNTLRDWSPSITTSRQAR